MCDIKVYKMNDYAWVASSWGKEKTNEWYKDAYGLSEEENPIEDIVECDLDKDGMWSETNDPEDVERLGDEDEIINVVIVNGKYKEKPQFGDLQRIDNSIFKYISFREAVKKISDIKEPYIIASIDWC